MSSGGFNFNPSGTSAQSSGGLFGTSGANNSASAGTGGGLFGNTNNNNTGSTPTFSFGTTSTSGSGSNDNKSGGGGLFGGGPGGNSLFGQQAGNKATESKPSLFGGIGNSQQAPGTPGQQPSSSKPLFGSTTPAPSSTTNFFGNPSTTPAGQPPTTSMFGASTGGSTSQAQAATQPTFSFGKPAGTSASTTAVPAPTSTLFGQQQPSSGGIFGQKTENAQPATGGFFASKPATDSSTAESASSVFGGGNTSSTPQASGSSLFGNAQGNTPQSSATANIFGAPKPNASSASSTTLFNTQKPAETSAQPSSAATFSFPSAKKDDKPADSGADAPTSFFSPSTVATTTSAPQQSSSSIFTPTNTSSQATSSLFSNTTSSSSTSNNFFAKPAAPARQASEQSKPSGFTFPSLGGAANTSASTTEPGTTAAPKSLFPTLSNGNDKSSASPAPTTTASATTTSASAPTSNFFNLGGGTTSSSQTTSSAATAPAPAMAAAPSGFGASALGASTLGASTTGPAPPAQSRLRNKTMDEILTRWASDLTRYSKEFKTHAETIAHWDQIIVDNSAKIDNLYVKTRTCEKQTMSVEMQLTAVENQQNELDAWLNKYESDVDEMLAKDGPAQNELGGPDQERERTYKLAEKVGERLDDMGRDLQSMIEEVNAANASLGKSNKADEPITQIVKILNSHLSQLQAIDQGTSALQAKVTAAQKAASGVNYMNGSMRADNRAAVDDFYRSYMGRR